MSTVLIGLILVCGTWAVAASLLIAQDLERRGVRVSYLWLRVMILKYLGQYRQMTLQETGQVGSLFYHYVIPLNIALALTVILTVVMLR